MKRSDRSIPTPEQFSKSLNNMLVSAASMGARMITYFAPQPLVSVAGSIAHAMGFDKPLRVNAGVTVTSPFACRDITLSSGMSDAICLSRNPAQQPVVLPAIDGADEMHLATYASRPGLLYRNTVSDTNVYGDLITRFPINPRLCNLTGIGDNVFYPTPAALCTIPFGAWRGTMAYKFYFSASSFHRFKVRITVYYGLDMNYDPTPAPGYDNTHTVVVDVVGRTEFGFTVPFVHAFPWARQSIGAVYLTLETPFAPIAGSSNSPVTVLTYASCRADLEVSEPDGHMFIDAGTVTASTDPVAHGSPTDDFLGPLPPLFPGTSTSTGGGVFLRDVITHMSDVLRSPALWASPSNLQAWQRTRVCVSPQREPAYVFIGGTGPTGNVGLVSGGIANGFQPLHALTSSTSVVGANNLFPIIPTLADHFALGFLWQRGGARLYLTMATGGSANAVFVAPDCMTDPSIGATYSTTSVINTFPVVNYDYTLSPSPELPIGMEIVPYASSTDSASNRVFMMREFEVPYKSRFPFISTTRRSPTSGTYAGNFTGPFASADSAVCCSISFTGSDGDVTNIHRSMADDYRLMGASTLTPVYLVYNGGALAMRSPTSTAYLSTYLVPSGAAFAMWGSVAYF
jgi:hypothetical protein